MTLPVKFIRERDVLEIAPRKRNWNKGQGSVIEAQNDFEALVTWINERSINSDNTRANYIKEANRILLWCGDQGVSLSELTRDDVSIRYRDFLSHPPEHYVGTKVSRSDLNWQPFFTGTPTKSSVNQSLGVVCAMLGWLKAIGYLELNPAEMIPRDKGDVQWRRRAIPDSALLCVRDFLDEMPVATPIQIRRQARMRWLFNLLRLTGLRISEVQGAKMKQFVSETRGGKTRTFLEIVGKGKKPRNIPAISELIDELVLYRKSLGLTPFPSRTEETPLVCSIETFKEKSPQEEVLEEKSNGKKKKKVKDANDHLTRQSIHNAVKLLIDRTTKRLMELECDEDAEILSRVSSHWFRHTYATKLLDSGASLSTGRDNLGHANISTTNLYSHSGQDKRFDETEGIGKMLKD